MSNQAMSNNVVEVRNLSRRFDKLWALEEVNFTIQPGLVYGLVGANGAGKTTLIKHVLGLLKAKQGSVRVFGLDPVAHPVEVLSRIGYLSEERDLPEWMRIDEFLSYYSFQWYDFLGMALLSGLSMLVTIHAVGRQRHGEAIRWSLLPKNISNVFLANRFVENSKAWFEACAHPQSLRNSWTAQTWLELRRSGNLLFVVFATPLLVLAFIAGVPLLNESWGGAHSPRMWLGAILLSPMIFQLLATDAVIGLRNNQGSTQLSQFDATRPLRCDEMIAIKLAAVGGWSCLGSLLMIATAFAHSTFVWNWQYWQELQQAIAQAFQQVAAGSWNQGALDSPSFRSESNGGISFVWLATFRHG